MVILLAAGARLRLHLSCGNASPGRRRIVGPAPRHPQVPRHPVRLLSVAYRRQHVINPPLRQRLGYVKVSSFSQAFRRWKGMGLREFRARQLARHRSPAG